jgi:hypothetical protein
MSTEKYRKGSRTRELLGHVTWSEFAQRCGAPAADAGVFHLEQIGQNPPKTSQSGRVVLADAAKPWAQADPRGQVQVLASGSF